MELKPRCSLEHSNFKLFSSFQFGNVSEIVVPKLKFHNHSNWELSKHVVDFQPLDLQNMSSIEEKIKRTKQNLNLNNINYHDIHHYTLIYVCFMIIIIIVVYQAKQCI